MLNSSDSRITTVRFETAEDEVTIMRDASLHLPLAAPPPIRAYGAVEGRVQTVTSRDSLRFALYDQHYDRAVSCYVSTGQEDLLRDIWDRQARVYGWVSRDPIAGRPTSVRDVSRIDLLEDPGPGSYLHARGIAPAGPHEPSPEELIRRLRDA